MDIYHELLQRYWGYVSFRPLQEDIIRSVCAGKDTLGLMPTGGGKSITFQVPTLAMEGICIVVTPLIALMKDQVDNLKRIGIKATAIHSGLSREDMIAQLENCIFGNYKFLYVSPERLGTELFQNKLGAMNVCLLAIDESHCISQWGYDFRPSYLKIADIRTLLPGVPVLALTATATPEVVDDIQERLHFKEKNVFRKSFSRPNLAYIVRKTDDKLSELVHVLQRVPGSAIVYVRNRKKTAEIAAHLKSVGISAEYFHAGLLHDEKIERQNRWKAGETRVIVSTNAFGMGIDKPDVRLVIHLNMPGSLEEYYQEAGRAGRDEKKSYAVYLCGSNDVSTLKKRTNTEFPDKGFVYDVYEKLANYYQVAMGFGLNTVHDFQIEDFCKVFKLPIQQTHYALKLLDLAGYLEYDEEVDNASRLLFTCTREELYGNLHQNPLTDSIMMAILRSYTGLFSDYAYIDERVIAKRSGCTPDDVYRLLVNLSKYNIVKYIPEKHTPMIVYRQAREEQRYLSIPRVVYEERKARAEKRIAKVIEYVQSETVCRARMLLRYFGEELKEDCGTCDVCLSRHESGLKRSVFSRIRKLLVERLPAEGLPVEIVAESIPYPYDQTMQVIRFLIDHDGSFHLKNTILYIN
ncbi:MAG TPA: RecQ family ATP-dependent DNA helicase [Parabacteroides sp.]|nr:RecQ family ATP-dependent DNA helicase [Parabacteroides sp.]